MCWSLFRTRFHNVYSSPRVATFRQANDLRRLRRSGEPSRLSLRKSWISPPLKPLLKCVACEYTVQNRWLLEREERNSNDNNEWWEEVVGIPQLYCFLPHYRCKKSIGKPVTHSPPFVKSSYQPTSPSQYTLSKCVPPKELYANSCFLRIAKRVAVHIINNSPIFCQFLFIRQKTL